MHCWETFKFQVNNARYGLTEYSRLIDLGYTTEHFRVSIQVRRKLLAFDTRRLCLQPSKVRQFERTFNKYHNGASARQFAVLQFACGCGLASTCMTVNGVRGFFDTSPLWIFLIIRKGRSNIKD